MTVAPARDHPASQPRIWVLRSYRAGENNQILGLAEALAHRFGWQFDSKTLVYRGGGISNLFRRTTLNGIDRAASDPLLPPWPDLIISAGFRNEAVCRWIRRAAGGCCKLVFIGRTWMSPNDIDLTVTTPQYRVAEHPNVLQNTLTLHRIGEDQLHAAHDKKYFADLAQPVTAVMLGGSSGPYVLGPHAASALANGLNQLEGTLLISSSARTPDAFLQQLQSSLTRPHHVYRFRANDAGNPYFLWLAGSDRFCVTADSVSLLSEAVATGKPVTVFDPLRCAARDRRAAAIAYQWLMHYGPHRTTRDVGQVHAGLHSENRITWFDEAVAGCWPGKAHRGSKNLLAATERVRALLN